LDNNGINSKLASWMESRSILLSPDSIAALQDWLSQSAYWDPDASLLNKLGPLLQQFPELEAGIVHLVPFLLSTRSPGVFVGFLERDRDALPVLMRILSLPTPAASWLVDDEDCFDWLRLSAGKIASSEQLRDVIATEVLSIEDEEVRLASMRSYRRRETLRVLCAHFLHGMPWYDVQQQLTCIADAAFYSSWLLAISEMRGGVKRREKVEDGLLAMAGGGFGGFEMDFESPLSIQFLSADESSAETRGAHWEAERARVVQRTIFWLAHRDGFAYRVDSFFGSGEPEGCEPAETLSSDRLLCNGRQWLQQIENQGRTLHRLSLLRRRRLVGSGSFFKAIDQQIPDLIFRRSVSGADIAGLSAFYRRIKRAVTSDETPSSSIALCEILISWREELTFLVHYLQLLHGTDDESIRVTNTRAAIGALANVNHITESERRILDTTWKEISTVILQLQSKVLNLPNVSYSEVAMTESLASAFESCRESIRKSRQILQHMQSDAFIGDKEVEAETDLILDPNPSVAWADEILKKHGFVRLQAAYRNLQELAKEDIQMLSTKRCRHFLASIAPRLLQKIQLTPNPDLTLENLVETTRSLGGKGILWELFSVHEPSMDLYIRICGASPYLVSILTKNPGMIDELLDSLMLNRLPTEAQLEGMLYDLCRGAVDIEPILASFKNAMHLNVGVRDILGKESVSATHRALADIADVCVRQVIENCYGVLVTKVGVPKNASGNPCPFTFVTVGKYGSREPNYHSDMSLLCLYESDGLTAPLGFGRHQPLENSDFFHQLTYRVTQSINRLGRFGRLYEAKPWLITENARSTIAWRIDEFECLFQLAEVSAIKRLEYCSARVFYGDPLFKSRINDVRLKSLVCRHWTVKDSVSVLHHRHELEHGVAATNIKRGSGGTIEVELLSKLLLLQNCRDKPEYLVNGTVDCLNNLKDLKLISQDDFLTLHDGYLFLRRVESGLRLMNTTARHDLPVDQQELQRLAYVLGLDSDARVDLICQKHRSAIRLAYERISNSLTSA
jgi:[glutamine synthetase] adenylyltransferase / [glutamine synthetase]-adenylyl-L-tyrosine phosphorylase